MKTCTRCGQVKDLTEFYSHVKHGPTPECKVCSKNRNSNYWKKNKKELNESNKRWRKNNKEKVAKNGRAYALKRKYGITVEQFDQMLVDQKHRCPICNRHESENIKDHRTGKAKEFAVDHCHKTGRIRQLLCSTCNTILGLVAEDFDVVERIRLYLLKHNEVGCQD